MTSQNTTTPFLRGSDGRDRDRKNRAKKGRREKKKKRKKEEKRRRREGKKKMPAGVHVSADCAFCLIMTWGEGEEQTIADNSFQIAPFCYYA